MKLHIEYFAALREQAGIQAESVDTSLSNPLDVYAMIREQHNFTLHSDDLKLAVNDEFASWDTELKDGDRIVFIPPVSGG